MATREALAIRREAAFARIAEAAGIEPPAANRDPDVTLTQFVEWAADLIAGPVADEPEPGSADGSPEPEPDAGEAPKPARKARKAAD